MTNTEKIKRSLVKRYRREKRFRAAGMAAVMTAFIFLIILLTDIMIKAWPAFQQNWIKLEVSYIPGFLDIPADATVDDLRSANYRTVTKRAIYALFPDIKKRREKRELVRLFSSDAEYQIRDFLLDDPKRVGGSFSVWVLADDDVDTYVKSGNTMDERMSTSRMKPIKLVALAQLEEQGRIDSRLNWMFLTQGDSREPELAGIAGALKGSFYTLLITLSLSFPLGVASALYLEEFAPQNRWADIIEVNINNLAAVPSIVFGLLGLAVFINFFGVPRSAPLVGGMVLTLMTLPTIIIASRAAIKAVPPSLREAALGIGASKMQMVFQHVLPLSMPGILTGTIIGLAQALGETAPLLMIGMIAFIVDVPQGFIDPSTVMPVQIYLWADSPERAFVAKTSAAIIVLLGFLIVMNLIAVVLRKKFERRW
jgi:phosphate transport system permease protein